MKKSVKIILGIISAAMAVVCVLCILYIVQYVRGNSLNDKLANDIASDMTVAVPKAEKLLRRTLNRSRTQRMRSRRKNSAA